MHGLTGGDWKRTGNHRYRASPRPSRHLGYVLAVASNRRVSTGKGPVPVDRLAAQLGPGRWQRVVRR